MKIVWKPDKLVRIQGCTDICVIQQCSGSKYSPRDRPLSVKTLVNICK